MHQQQAPAMDHTPHPVSAHTPGVQLIVHNVSARWHSELGEDMPGST